MQRFRNATHKLYAAMGDALVLSLTYVLAIRARVALRELWTFDLFPGDQRVIAEVSPDLHLGMLPAVLFAWLLSLWYFRTYDDLHRVRTNQLLVRLIKATTGGALGTLLILFAAQQTDQLSRSLFFGFPFMSFGALWVVRRLQLGALKRRYARGLDTRNILIVGNAGEALPLIKSYERHPEWGLRVLGVVHAPTGKTDHDDSEISEIHYKVLGQIPDLPRLLEAHPVDQVYMTGRAWDTRTLRMIADSCEELGVDFSMDANFLGLRVAQANLGDFEGNSVLMFSSTPAQPEALAIKRLMDVVLSGLALLALSPVFFFVALAIKITDPGPIFFGQERSGLYGRTFTMWKFRSMVADAEKLRAQLEAQNEMDGPVFKMTHDPRITAVGRFIRKTSIDEFPQFWNVFRGEMSLVGPRPPIPAEVERYERWQRRRLSMKPGLTCIWQVSGRNNVDFRTWMKQDLEYIDNWSLLLDIKLLAMTVPVVLLGTGAK
ncbi:MAG: sugar transferase [Alphaproteobacteria bacterium]|nr:sugar transferase [Alphaproteobacteria bacterium]MCB9793404.1 sugar transferase [Alphaproteobacteria bacterium]